MMARVAAIHDIVFDARHPASIARFWAAALDGYDVAPYDEAELERLRQQGVYDTEDDPNVVVEAPGRHPRILFQRVPEGKTVKNRVHLDLRADDVASEVRRLCALGARVFAERENLITMLDPEGNEFCVLR
jgi:hypothetical protein